MKDKTADVLKVFQPHILPNTEMCVDPGTENSYFSTLDSIIQLHQIPGPIHIDPNDPRKNTQTVETSHSGVKMRLRLGRGLHRHNLQAVLDLEDFIYNRTNGDPPDIFKKLGDSATTYVQTCDTQTIRKSLLAYKLPQDDVEEIVELTIDKITQLCSTSVFYKAKRYEKKKSKIYRTQSSTLRNCITGQFKAARIYEQSITWGTTSPHCLEPHPFSLSTINVYCSCKYFTKETVNSGFCCSHIIGQMRRVIFLT